MKKAPRKQKKTNRKKQASSLPTEPSRRSFVKAAPYIVGGVIAAAGLGTFGISTVRADLAEQDLSVVGSGRPVIVQIHDPSCPVCRALQKEARAALSQIEDEDLVYRVASINSATGQDFANRYGASHATLLFFDPQGNITQRVYGGAERDTLQADFIAHIQEHSRQTL